MSKSFYRRPLPSSLVAFSSAEGRRRFNEAVCDGTAESFFPLVEQFQTQSEPAYCGLTSLSVVLNALAIDPQRVRCFLNSKPLAELLVWVWGTGLISFAIGNVL
mmetsp:Transcript_42030/g.164632  ORF Transcript_42030/g.164632 Transcript_42030/m.164632 type:complete len:104 (+) Transcript_42030:200-511(+)